MCASIVQKECSEYQAKTADGLLSMSLSELTSWQDNNEMHQMQMQAA